MSHRKGELFQHAEKEFAKLAKSACREVYKYTIIESSNNASGTMRTDIQRIKAKELKAGMTRAFSNPRFDYLVDEVSGPKYGEIKVEHGDFTASDYLNPADVVWIVAH